MSDAKNDRYVGALLELNRLMDAANHEEFIEKIDQHLRGLPAPQRAAETFRLMEQAFGFRPPFPAKAEVARILMKALADSFLKGKERYF